MLLIQVLVKTFLHILCANRFVNRSYFTVETLRLYEKKYISDFSPSVILDVKTKSDEASSDVQAAIDRALSEALGDGKVGDLDTKPDSVRVDAPKGRYI